MENKRKPRANSLAKIRAAAAPIYPKKGAEAGQASPKFSVTSSRSSISSFCVNMGRDGASHLRLSGGRILRQTARKKAGKEKA